MECSCKRGDYYRYSDIVFSHWHTISGNYPKKRVPFVHGVAFWNYPSGQRKSEGQYNRGIRSGVWHWYSEDGDLIRTVDFGSKEYEKRPFRADSVPTV